MPREDGVKFIPMLNKFRQFVSEPAGRAVFAIWVAGFRVGNENCLKAGVIAGEQDPVLLVQVGGVSNSIQMQFPCSSNR